MAKREYDLTQRMSPFMDIHLLFPILDFLSEHSVYPHKEILKVQMDLAGKTSMIKYELGFHDELHGIERAEDDETLPDRFEAKKAEIISKNEELAEACQPLLMIKDDVEKLAALKKKLSEDEAFEVEGSKIDSTTLDKIYEYARFGMNMGNYEFVRECLSLFRSVCTDRQKSLDALWGQLAASILDYEVDDAFECWKMLKQNIDKTKPDSERQLMVLQQRTFLVHWGLFVLFSLAKPEDSDPKITNIRWAQEFSELFFPQQSNGNRVSRDDSIYLTVVRTNCPWIMRYIAAAVIIQRQRGPKDSRQNPWRQNRRIADFVQILKDESIEHSDPITRFLQYLYADHDLVGAKNTLAEMESVLKSDFFFFQIHGRLHDEDHPELFVDLFVKCAREMWLETFCDIHHKIDLHMLSTQLNLDIEDAEEWMVGLIVHRDAEGSDPKIDKEAGQIVMGKTFPSVYQTMVGTTRDLLRRSLEMQNSVVAAKKPHYGN